MKISYLPIKLGATVFCLLILLHLILSSAAGAEESKISNDSWTFSFYFENDLFAGTDQHYTNGTKLSWISPDLTAYAKSDKLPSWSLPMIQKLPFINEPGLKRNISLSVGQNIYTPVDISLSELLGNDRPYAGWTYFGAAFHSKNDRRLDSMEIQLGIVGPLALAEQTQNLIHSLRNIPLARGWDNQLDNEPGLALVYERKNRFLQGGGVRGLGFDVITSGGGALGNVYTYVNAGAEFRWGWNLPLDFGVSLIRPAGDTNAPLDARDPRLANRQKFSLHLFGLANGRISIRDIFLDGNTFADSHGIDKNAAVADLAAGVSLIVQRFKLSYTQVLRTSEFEKNDERDQIFGSISLSFSY